MDHGLPIDLDALDARGARGIVVALSGGLDSTVLLHRLAQSPGARARGLRALHVHHGLHPEADRWQAHCAALCAGLGLRFDAVRVVVAADGRGLEAAARQARHDALRARCGDGEAVALAHHLDDQAETFLLRALRASGPDGLAAMRPWRRFGPGWLWRPLLGHPRAALEAYGRAHGLAWIDDPSNASDAHDRNYLRLLVLPVLRARWPQAAAALAQAAEGCAEAADLLSEGDRAGLAQARHADGTLDVPALMGMDAPRRARLLRAWVASLDLPPLPREGLRRLEQVLLTARPDAAAEFAWHGARIRRWRDRLHAQRRIEPLDAAWSAHWDGSAPLALPAGGELRLAPPTALPGNVYVRARHGGERIRLPGRAHTHALKHVLQDRGVPPWLREHLPLLVAADGEVLAAGDLAVSARLQAWLDAAGARLLWSPPSAVRR